jgi:hypothetical protein
VEDAGMTGTDVLQPARINSISINKMGMIVFLIILSSSTLSDNNHAVCLSTPIKLSHKLPVDKNTGLTGSSQRVYHLEGLGDLGTHGLWVEQRIHFQVDPVVIIGRIEYNAQLVTRVWQRTLNVDCR